MSKPIMRQLLDNPANRPTLVVGVVCVFLLLLWLVQIVASPEPIVLPPPTAADADALPDTSLAAVVDIPSLAEYESVIERPLFNEDRLPSEDEDADAHAEGEMAEGNTQAPPMQLAGVVLTGEHRIAMLTREGQPLRVEVGMDVDGWVLEDLEPRRAILSNGIASVELELPVYTPPASERRGQRGQGRDRSAQRGQGRDRSAQREQAGSDRARETSGQAGQAMNVRERIQQAREERKRSQEYMRAQAEGKSPSAERKTNH